MKADLSGFVTISTGMLSIWDLYFRSVAIKALAVMVMAILPSIVLITSPVPTMRRTQVAQSQSTTATTTRVT